MHLQPVFAELAATLDGTSDRLFEHGITLPCGSGMTIGGLRQGRARDPGLPVSRTAVRPA